MIACENLTRYYGSFAAVDNLSFSIPRGAVCALAGPNGAGKTTTMRMLCTLLRPSRGKAWIGGHDLVKNSLGVRRLIGYLPEAFQLYEDMLVEQYLTFFGKAYGLDEDIARARISDFLERLGLNDKRTTKVGTLSRGMRQRLGVAKSFLHDPDVVFLDEPASGLDPIARTELRDFLRYQQYLGKTIVVSSHVLKELADFCDHMAIIQNGKLVEFGPLAGVGGVLEKYSNAAAVIGRRYTMRVLQDAARLEELLKTVSGLRSLERRDNGLSFDVEGSDEKAAAVLSQIVTAGYQVTKYAPEEIDLEHIYRKASAEPAPVAATTAPITTKGGA
jgi:ABC-2 type transport system ATP-binding protein